MRTFFKFWWVWCALTAGVCFWFLPPLPPFQLKEIVVVIPPTHLSETKLVELAGVTRGENLLTLSLKKVHKNILRFPWIEEVQLAKAYPGHLIISVKEQRPVALVKTKGLYLVNRHGRAFKKLSQGDPKNLPIITGFSKPTKKDLRPLTDLIGSFGERDSFRSIGLSEIHWNSKKGVSFYTVRPVVRVVLGKKDWEKRLDRFSQILPEIQTQNKKPVSIDLTYEKRIFLKRG